MFSIPWDNPFAILGSFGDINILVVINISATSEILYESDLPKGLAIMPSIPGSNPTSILDRLATMAFWQFTTYAPLAIDLTHRIDQALMLYCLACLGAA